MILKRFKGEAGYRTLKHLPFNRDFTLRAKLISSMKKRGFIQAISVVQARLYPNGPKEYYIADGQHRALAASYLNIPFYANVLDGEYTPEDLVRLVAVLNNTSQAWTLAQYSNAWMQMGKEDYGVLLNLHKERKVPISYLSQMLCSDNPNATKLLKEGLFKITSLKSTMKTLDYIRELSPMNGRMVKAFHKLRLTTEKFHFASFRLKFEKVHKELKAEKLDDYYKAFLNLINK